MANDDRKILRELQVPLTDQEVLHRGIELARVLTDIKVKTEAAKEASTKAKNEIKKLATRMEELREQTNTRQERREVPCYERQNFRTASVEIVRADDGSVLDTRAMLPEERQQLLTEVAPEPPPAEGKPADPDTATH